MPPPENKFRAHRLQQEAAQAPREAEAQLMSQALNSAPGGGPFAAFGEVLMSDFVDDYILPVPRAGLAAAGAAASMVRPGDQSFGEEFRQQREQFPANLFDLKNLASGMRTGLFTPQSLLPGGETPQEAFGRHHADISGRREALEQQHPVATGLGELGAAGAGLASLRQPIAKAIGAGERQIPNLVQRWSTGRSLAGARERVRQVAKGGSPETRLTTTGRSPPASSELREITAAIFNRPSVKKLLRGAGRSVETGMEAAVFDMLQGEDPLETAGLAAGSQLMGSALLQFGHPLVSGIANTRLGRWVGTAFVLGGMFEIMSMLTPGGNNYILPNIEQGFAKVTLALAAGGAMAALGFGRAGRGAGQIGERAPLVMDAIAAVPRGATLSILEHWADAPPERQALATTVSRKIVTDPNYFGEAFTNRIGRAMSSGRYMQELDRLMKNDKFRELVQAM